MSQFLAQNKSSMLDSTKRRTTNLTKEETAERLAKVAAAMPGTLKEIEERTGLSYMVLYKLLKKRMNTDFYICDYRIPGMIPVYAAGANRTSVNKSDIDLSDIKEYRRFEQQRKKRERLQKVKVKVVPTDSEHNFSALYNAFNIRKPPSWNKVSLNHCVS